MTRQNCFILVIFFITTLGFSQDKEVLMTIDDEPVYANEFKRVYKKNLDLVKDETQKDVENYLDLFIDYKLKIAAAYEDGLHEKTMYKRDFAKYEAQLSRNYLFENKVAAEMAQEAYDRSLEEVEAAHILIKADYSDKPQDTLAAYKKIAKAREKAVSGQDFAELVKQYSEEPGAAEREGKLGYFSAFTMVYPFETAAYKTKEGEISEIVRTQFGYHILKVTDRRKKEPEIQVSHIMIGHKGDSSMTAAKQRIDEIYTLLQEGKSFESLAKQFSEDRNSAKKGGELAPFSRGALRAPEFEEAAYSLQKKDEISEPVKTTFGWHIIKFSEKLPIPSFEDQRVEMEKRVTQGNRSKIITSAVNEKLKEKYNFKAGTSYQSFFDNYVSDSLQKKKWKMTEIPAAQNKVLFTMGDTEVKYQDFANFISERQPRMKVYKTKAATLSNLYEEFEDIELKSYFRSRLETENEDYAATISEYRDGLLIFDVMNENIWNKAKTDTIGLKAYYDVNKNNYMWQERVNVTVVSATSQPIAERVQQLLQKKEKVEDIKSQLAKEDITLIVTQDTLEINSNILPPGFVAEEGISKVYPDEDSFVVAQVKEVLAPSIKDFEDVKGRVTTDYQNKLERQWMEGLRNSHTVKVNKKTLKKVIKELQS